MVASLENHIKDFAGSFRVISDKQIRIKKAVTYT